VRRGAAIARTRPRRHHRVLAHRPPVLTGPSQRRASAVQVHCLHARLQRLDVR
jgi:hypothetical protein